MCTVRCAKLYSLHYPCNVGADVFSEVGTELLNTLQLLTAVFKMWWEAAGEAKGQISTVDSVFNPNIKLLKPTGHVMHHQFNIQQLYALPPYCIYVFCIYLRTNSDLCHLQHKLIGFYNRDEKCLQRGTDWVFK